MNTSKEQQENKITLSLPEVGKWSVTEYELRKNIRDYIISSTPSKKELGKSPYGEGVLYQYWQDAEIDSITDSSNNYQNPFNDFMFELLKWDGCIFDDLSRVKNIIYEMLDEELIREYKQAAKLFGFRNKKELKVKFIHCDYPKARSLEIKILQLN